MPWLQLRIEDDSGSAERLAELLPALGAQAVSLEDARDQPLYEPAPGTTPLWARTTVVALFAADTDLAPVLERLRELSASGTLPAHRVERLEDQDWTRVWMQDFHPLRFGQRLWICPSWCEPPEADAVNILLDPGLAFGTGTHATTTLCLRWLDAHPPQGQLVVDYGCGSGVLAIAALKLGARHAWAIDHDPQALAATEANAERNAIPPTNLYAALPEDVPPLQADLLLANILAEPLIALAATLAELLRDGGRLVLSGVLGHQVAGLAAAYAPWFELDEPLREAEWALLSGTRRATPPAQTAGARDT